MQFYDRKRIWVLSQMSSPSTKDDDELTRIKGTKEYRTLKSPGERAWFLYHDYSRKKSEILSNKIAGRSSLQHAIRSGEAGYKIGHVGNRFKLTSEDEDSIVQHIKMLLNERIPVYLEDVLLLVSNSFLPFIIILLY